MFGSFCLNFDFLQICAVVLVAIGIWMMNDCTFLDELLRNRLYMSTGYTILISGCFIVVLSMFGCIGNIFHPEVVKNV